MLELRPLAVRGLRWSGWSPGSCWARGLRQADQALLLDAVDRSGLSWRRKTSLGQVPDPHATAIGGHVDAPSGGSQSR